MLKKYEYDSMISQKGVITTINEINENEKKIDITLSDGYTHEIIYVCSNKIEIRIVKKD